MRVTAKSNCKEFKCREGKLRLFCNQFTIAASQIFRKWCSSFLSLLWQKGSLSETTLTSAMRWQSDILQCIYPVTPERRANHCYRLVENMQNILEGTLKKLGVLRKKDNKHDGQSTNFTKRHWKNVLKFLCSFFFHLIFLLFFFPSLPAILTLTLSFSHPPYTKFESISWFDF